MHSQEIAMALQMQKLESEMSQLKTEFTQLKENLASNTKATEELLAAWNTSRGTLGFIKGLSIWAAAIAGGLYSINKLLGH